jgi:hypothetical protein
MMHLIMNLLLLSAIHCGKEGLPVTPVDVAVGRQVVDLRLPLEMHGGGRLMLFVRDLRNLGISGGDVVDQFKAAVPEGSVRAFLTGRNGEKLTLEHTGYSFYRGYKGLVLSEAEPVVGGWPQLYSRLEIDSKTALTGVRMVWIDRSVLQVWDVYPRL